MSDVTIIIAGLTFALGCFFGNLYKENQVSYRLNRLLSDMNFLRERLERLESPDSYPKRPPTVEYRK